MRHGCDGGCEDVGGITANIGGERTEEDVLLVFDAENPLGVELNAGGTGRRPLRYMKLWAGCLLDDCGNPLPKGARAIVTGNVISRERTIDVAGEVLFVGPSWQESNVQATQPRIKLAVTACKEQGPTIVDSDSSVVVEADGSFEVGLLLPASWRMMGTFDTPSPIGAWVDTVVRVRACPLDCCWCPDGVLSEWINTDPEAVTLLALARPRRARTLAVQAVDAGGPTNPLPVIIEWSNVLGGLPPIGATTFAANTQQTIEPFGAAPWLRVNGTGTGIANLRWGIR